MIRNRLQSFLLLTSLGLSPAASAATEILELSSLSTQANGQAAQSIHVKIRVPNYGFEKNVSVIFQQEKSAPQVVVARYLGPADAGHEIWEAYATLGPGDQEVHVEYAEAPDVGERPTWILRAGAGPVLFGDRALMSIYDEPVIPRVNGVLHAAVKNLAYGKQVRAHYSTDGWQSSQTLELQYQPVFYHGHGQAVLPNAEGFEIWSGHPDLPETATQLTYYLTYEVAGQLFIDNNFGHNYTLQIR